MEYTAPPIPQMCSHDDLEADCNDCWSGYPYDWSHGPAFNTKIYDAIHTYNTHASCVLYQVDSNDCGRFKDPGKIVAQHGNESETWRRLVTEKVGLVVLTQWLFVAQ